MATTKLGIRFKKKNIGSQYRRLVDDHSKLVRLAARGAMQDARDEILNRGRQDIASAGNFGSRWTDGLHGEVVQGPLDNFRLDISHDVPYFMVHQKGALIKGRPLLWIPLPGTDPNERGDFFQTSRRGNLLLFKKEGQGLRPLRVAKESVRIPKRFHVLEIIREVSRKLGAFFRSRMENP